ncbi:MAG TPA: site-specific integrase [Methylobacter sp.]|jgi:integrase
MTSKIASKAARGNLPVDPRPYWRELERGLLSLGYRRTPGGGVWVGRRYIGAQKYQQKTLGVADDRMPADGVKVFDYAGAVKACRAWYGETTATPEITVAVVLENYLKVLAGRGKATHGTELRIKHDILPSLGHVPLASLSTKKIEDWLHALAARERHTRGRGGQPSRPVATKPDDAARKRRASASRAFTILKAALNLAYRQGLVETDAQWRRVDNFKGVNKPNIRWFSAEEIAKLLAVVDGDFKPLFIAALMTGCRYGELCRLKVKDFAHGSVFIEKSKSGKPRHVRLTDEGNAFFKSIVIGRDCEALMFTCNGHEWKKSEQAKPMNEACKAAGFDERGWFHCLRHTHASHCRMAGMPISVLAEQLGHSDSRITERNYAHLGANHIAETVKAFGPKFAIG